MPKQTSQRPTIQSFFQPEVASVKKRAHSSTTREEPGDGFDPAEREASVKASLPLWKPTHEYDKLKIKELTAGPGRVTVTGRVVNFYERKSTSDQLHKPQGYFNIIIQDETKAFKVKLYYAKVTYDISLGQLVTIWTPHMSLSKSSSLDTSSAWIETSIFPEHDRTCHVSLDRDDEPRQHATPPGYRKGRPMSNLFTLEEFLAGSHEVSGAKLLVCVKSIGGRKKFLSRKDVPIEKVDLVIFDRTADISLVLWGSTCASSSTWIASQTVLFLSGMTFSAGQRPSLSLNQDSILLVDPEMDEVDWLKEHARSLTQHNHVNPPLPMGVFDVEDIQGAETRVLFTLGQIDEFVRKSLSGTLTGYCSLLITELHLASLHQQRKLFCAECCGIPLFSNASTSPCRQCDKLLILRPNPRIIGLLVDETGSVGRGGMIWSDEAWKQLLGGDDAAVLASRTPDDLKALESRLLFLRILVLFGWAGGAGAIIGDTEGKQTGLGAGRLVVLRVMDV